MTLTFEPLLPPVVWVTVTVLSVALWIVYAARRPAACRRLLWGVIMTLTAAGLASVLTVLLNPIWLEPLPPPAGKPLLTILVDQSSSMDAADGTNAISRYSVASNAIIRLIDDLKPQFDIRIQGFAEQSRSVDPADLEMAATHGRVTDIATPLMDALVADRPQGQAVLLVSDGVHNAHGDTEPAIRAAESAKTRNAPVYTATVGGDLTVNDLEIRVRRSQELAFVGQSIPVTVDLQQHGAVGSRVDVTLIDPSGQEVTRTIDIAQNSSTRTTFLITSVETGLFQYQVRTAGMPNEATTANNATTFQVRVVDKPVRALVLEGKPYWDAKFLLRMLTGDPSLEVDCIVRVSAERFLWRKLKLVKGQFSPNEDKENSDPQPVADSSATRPFERVEETEFVNDVKSILQKPDQLREYQILLLGREAEQYLSDAAVENIRTWIAQDGGSLVCYRGSPVAEPNQRLSRLLPVRWAADRAASLNESRFRIEVTERGDDLSWLRIGGPDGLGKLPSLSTSEKTESIKPLAVVLGRGKTTTGTSPVLTYQPYGTGKVVVVEGSGMWRWAFLPPNYREMESAYGTLWQSLLRWLISSGGLLPGEDVALQMDRVGFTEGESVSAVVLRRPELDSTDLPSVELLDETGQLVKTIQPIPVGEELGVYRVFIGALAVGHYQTQLKTIEGGVPVTKIVHFDVRPDLREKLEVSARSDLMQQIASVSGGEALAIDELAEIGSIFQSHLEQSRPVQYQRRTAWDRWWVLVTILVLWSVCWGLRRRTGLI